MFNQKGYVDIFEIVVILIILILAAFVPVSCHQDIKRKQAYMASIGVEMTYWDIFWVGPEVIINNGKITVNNEKETE